jgi:hypothetical protein
MWNNFLTCSHKEVIQNFILPPVKLYEKIASLSFAYCNIVFKPPIEIQPFVEGCFKTDVHSCPKIGPKDSDVITDAGIVTVYEELCRRYLLPVLSLHKRTYTIYRNIACYLCNNNVTLPEECNVMYPDYTEYNLQIHVLNQNQPMSIKDSLSADDIFQQYVGKCNVGYIRDEKLVSNCTVFIY